jgi:hypothetical protein
MDLQNLLDQDKKFYEIADEIASPTARQDGKKIYFPNTNTAGIL